MKKVLVYMLIFSILICPVLAIDENIYEARDFTEHPEQLAVLDERDAIKINWDDKEHKLMIRKLYPDQKKVELTAFIAGSEVPFYATITSKTSLQLDFNQDGEYDLKVSILNVLIDEKVVALKLEKLKKEPLQTTGSVVKEPEKNFYQNIFQPNIYLFAGLILLILGLWKRRSLLKTYKRFKKRQI